MKIKWGLYGYSDFGDSRMQYIVERDLFMSKVENYLNEKTKEGYDLVNIFITEQDLREGKNGTYLQASKATIIMSKE